MILIITRRDDLSADFFIQRLLERGIRYLRFDIDSYLKDVALHAELSNGRVVGEIVTPQGKAELDSVIGVWYRRAMTPELGHSDLGVRDRCFAQRESAHFLQGILGFLHANWVNHWVAVTKWERKLGQLALARSCGFQIPDTLISTNRDHLVSFASGKDLIAKTLSWGLVPTEAGFESVYTHAITERDLQDPAQSRLCPTLLQQRIRKVGDVRLTAIGPKRYAAFIASETSDGIDWRRPGTSIRYSEIDVPPSIAKGITQFMKASGLVYGAFDFAITDDQNWVFLEINPAGEFAWLEKELGWGMRDALIDELLRTEVSDA